MTSGQAEAHRAIHAVFKAEAPRLIAGLARIVRDVGIAEELSQDALVAALEQWPASGIPDNPGAWLMSAGKNRAINVLRRGKMLAQRHEQLGHEIETAHALNASTLRRRSTPGLETIFRKRGVAIAASAIVSPLIQERATRSRAFPRSLRSKARVLGRSFPRSQQGRGGTRGEGLSMRLSGKFPMAQEEMRISSIPSQSFQSKVECHFRLTGSERRFRRSSPGKPRPQPLPQRCRRGMGRSVPRLGAVVAHTDLGGMALFEEANWFGVKAAERVLKELGHSVTSWL